jgi:hypothetical protein
MYFTCRISIAQITNSILLKARVIAAGARDNSRTYRAILALAFLRLEEDLSLFGGTAISLPSISDSFFFWIVEFDISENQYCLLSVPLDKAQPRCSQRPRAGRRFSPRPEPEGGTLCPTRPARRLSFANSSSRVFLLTVSALALVPCHSRSSSSLLLLQRG